MHPTCRRIPVHVCYKTDVQLFSRGVAAQALVARDIQGDRKVKFCSNFTKPFSIADTQPNHPDASHASTGVRGSPCTLCQIYPCFVFIVAELSC